MAGRGLGDLLNHTEAQKVPQVMTEPGKKPSSTPTPDHDFHQVVLCPTWVVAELIRHFNTQISNNPPWNLKPSSDA